MFPETFIANVFQSICEDKGIIVLPAKIKWQKKTCCTSWHAKRQAQITIGMHTISAWFEIGFNEYKSLRKYFPKREPGYESMWAIAVHEAAHALTDSGNLESEHHSDVFARCLYDLLIEYPFEDFENLIEEEE